MMNIQPTYCGIEKEIGFTGHLTGMLTRVFLPQRAPHRFEMFIATNTGSGYLGRDAKFEFYKHIKTPDGKEISRGREDFYISSNIKPYKVTPPLVLSIMEFVLKKIFFFLQKELTPLSLPDKLPSYLFYGAKENDRVSFLYDDQPVEVTLKQKHHTQINAQENFQVGFESISKWIQHGIEKGRFPYLFMEDAKKDELFLQKGDWCRKLEPGAVIKKFLDDASFRATEEMSIPATKEKVERLNQILDGATKFTNARASSDTTLEIYTREVIPSNFTAVVNGRYVSLIASDSRGTVNRYVHLVLSKPCDPDTLECARDRCHGLVRFTFDYLP